VDQTPIGEVDLGKMFVFGDSIELMSKMEDGCVDAIVTDPPYAIDMKNLDTHRDVHRTEKEHDVAENLELLPRFLEQAYRVLRDDSFCVFWYDMEHHELLTKIATSMGFTVQRWPLIWVKTHTCRNSAPHHNYTKATEAAMVCRKGNARLKKPMVKNFIMADGLTERKMYDHPFIKPKDVWNFILEGVAHKGQTVLDPFAGQMSCPRAVLNAGMIPLAMEKNAYHFMRGMDHIEKLFKEMTLGKCKFVNDPRSVVTPDMIVKPNEQDND
jgi:DNA modification methylase